MRWRTAWLIPALAVALCAEDKEAARKLLDSAYEITASASIQVQVMSLLHIGHHYSEIDPAKSADYLGQAFAATAALSEESDTGNRSQMQGEIVKLTATVNLELAIELVRQLGPPAYTADAQHAAYSKIVAALAERKELDRAMEVLAGASPQADYPFDAASSLFERIPEGDPRRIILFGSAATAHAGRPAIGFAQLLGKHWRKVPKQMVDGGLQSILNQLLNRKADGSSSFGIVDGKDGTTKLQSRELKEFSLIMPALEALDPARAKDLKTKHTELAELEPETPPASDADRKEGWEDHGLLPVSFAASLLEEQDMVTVYRDWNKAAAIAAEALSKAEKDPSGALARAAEIPGPGMRAEVMARVAGSIGRKDVETVRSTIGRALALLKDIKPGDRVMARVALGEAAAEINDPELAVAAFTEAFRDAEALFKLESINKAIMEQWVSVGATRVIASKAAKKLGASAQTLLDGIQTADLALLARIEMAAALLGRDPTVGSMNVRWSK